MKPGFIPIRPEKYVELHLRSNPGVKRADLARRLEQAVAAARRGVRCQCGAPIWIIGSAEVGMGCFSCITGQAEPEGDYEIDLRPDGNTRQPKGCQSPPATVSSPAALKPAGAARPGSPGLKTVARNAPCPCGSDKKFKRCCLATQAQVALPGAVDHPPAVPPRFRFEPGSYGSAARGFMPSALCYEETAPGQWKEHFCLVRPACCLPGEAEASALAKTDLDEAFAAKRRGAADREMALVLERRGYLLVEQFQRAGSPAASGPIPF